MNTHVNRADGLCDTRIADIYLLMLADSIKEYGHLKFDFEGVTWVLGNDDEARDEIKFYPDGTFKYVYSPAGKIAPVIFKLEGEWAEILTEASEVLEIWETWNP